MSSGIFGMPSRYFYIGLAVIIAGYVCLRLPPVEGFATMSLAPILLVLGYVFLVPLGLVPSRRRSDRGAALFGAARPTCRTTLRLTGLGVFVASFLVYLMTLWPGPGWWDSGGYIVSAHVLGVQTSPGSVLLEYLGRLFLMMPYAVLPAVKTNLMTAMIVSLAVTTVYLTVLRLLSILRSDGGLNEVAAIVAAAVAALTFAFAETVWRHAVFTNPYAVSLLVAALMLYLVVRWWEDPSGPGAGNFLLLLAFLLGMDFNAHRSNVLIAPVFLLLILIRQPRILLNWRLWGGGVALFVLGLSMQLTNMFRAQLEPAMNMADPDSLSGLWDYLALKQTGVNVFGTDLFQRKGPLWDSQIKHEFLRYLGWNFVGIDAAGSALAWRAPWGIPALAAIIGLVYQLRRRLRLGLFFLGAFVLVSGLAILYLNIPENYFRYMDRHFFHVYTFIVLWAGVGCYFVIAATPKLLASRPRLGLSAGVLTALVIAALMPCGTLLANYGRNDMSNNYSAYDYGRNMLDSCRPGAILITAGDNDTFPIWYLQEVEGYRPDVICLNRPLLNTPWFLATVSKYRPDIPWTITVDSIEQLKPRLAPDTLITLPGIYPDTVIQTVRVPTEAGDYDLVCDQVLVNILIANNWQRPVYFSAGFGSRLPIGLGDHARMEGLVSRIVLEENATADRQPILSNLLKIYHYRGWTEGNNIDRTGLTMTPNYKMSFAMLAMELRETDPAMADSLEQKFLALWPETGGIVNWLQEMRRRRAGG